jgi:hypothetical protein
MAEYQLEYRHPRLHERHPECVQFDANDDEDARRKVEEGKIHIPEGCEPEKLLRVVKSW